MTRVRKERERRFQAREKREEHQGEGREILHGTVACFCLLRFSFISIHQRKVKILFGQNYTCPRFPTCTTEGHKGDRRRLRASYNVMNFVPKNTWQSCRAIDVKVIGNSKLFFGLCVPHSLRSIETSKISAIIKIFGPHDCPFQADAHESIDRDHGCRPEASRKYLPSVHRGLYLY